MSDEMVIALPSHWALREDIRNRVLTKLNSYDVDTREAVAMVVSELVENAIKYGEASQFSEEAQLKFLLQNDCVRIEVASNLSSKVTYEGLKARIDEIAAAAADKQALYIRRLDEIYERPAVMSAGLGLFRIAYEGGFSLSCGWAGGVLTIVATRTLGSEEIGR